MFTRISLIALGAMFMLAAPSAHAASISFSPASVTVTKGQTFTVTVNTDAGGAKLYTVKAQVSYPATLLEATGFSFSSGWMPLSQAGYDLIDNTAGTLVKTGGFPGGFTGVKSLGVITFKAKADGTATISTGSGTVAYDAQNKNAISGAQGSASVTVASAAAPAPKPATQPAAAAAATTAAGVSGTVGSVTAKPAASQVVAPAGADEDVSTTTGEEAATTTGTSSEEQTAAVGILASVHWWWILIVLAVAGVIWFVIAKRRNARRY